MELQLETRKCGNQRCTRTFRVLHESKQKYCSSSCANGIFGVAPFRARGKEDDDKAGDADLDMSERVGSERSASDPIETDREEVSGDGGAAGGAQSDPDRELDSTTDDDVEMDLDDDQDDDQDEDFDEASSSESRREF